MTQARQKEKAQIAIWKPLPLVQYEEGQELIVLFDNGEVRGYNDKWPMAMVTHYIIVAHSK